MGGSCAVYVARVADEARSVSGETRLRRELRVTIRRARERLKMSQEEFARALGDRLGSQISQSQISDWEGGRFEPRASVLLAIAELANLSIDELRGAGPPAIVDRIERLEAEVERLAALEHESERMGALLAQLIEALDHAGMWPVSASIDEAPASRQTEGKRG
jgi:transcriptional regulator with XRE-family HTH domain